MVEVSLVRSREGVLHAKNASVADAPPDAKDVEAAKRVAYPVMIMRGSRYNFMMPRERPR